MLRKMNFQVTFSSFKASGGKNIGVWKKRMESGVLDSLPEGLSAWERVAITANGNLQHIIASLHDKIVSIRVHQQTGKCRNVSLFVGDLKYVTATSRIRFSGNNESKINGSSIGQIIRESKFVPKFCLIDVTVIDVSYLQREYSLEIPGMHCHIIEVINRKVFDITDDRLKSVLDANENAKLRILQAYTNKQRLNIQCLKGFSPHHEPRSNTSAAEGK